MGQSPGRDKTSPMGRTNSAPMWQGQSPWRSPEGLPCQRPRSVDQRSGAWGHPGSQTREQGLGGPLPSSHARAGQARPRYSAPTWAFRRRLARPRLSRPHLRKTRGARRRPASPCPVSGHAGCSQASGDETRGHRGPVPEPTGTLDPAARGRDHGTRRGKPHAHGNGPLSQPPRRPPGTPESRAPRRPSQHRGLARPPRPSSGGDGIRDTRERGAGAALRTEHTLPPRGASGRVPGSGRRGHSGVAGRPSVCLRAITQEEEE